MFKKPFGWIVVGGLTGVVAVGLWFLFSKDVSSESHGRAVLQAGGRGAATVPAEGVPAESVPASGTTPKQASSSLVPLPSGSIPTPTAGIQSVPPLGGNA